MSLPIPSRLPSVRDIFQNAMLQDPKTVARIHDAMKKGVRPEDAERIQGLLQTRVIGRGMKWFLKTVAA